MEIIFIEKKQKFKKKSVMANSVFFLFSQKITECVLLINPYDPIFFFTLFASFHAV